MLFKISVEVGGGRIEVSCVRSELLGVFLYFYRFLGNCSRFSTHSVPRAHYDVVRWFLFERSLCASSLGIHALLCAKKFQRFAWLHTSGLGRTTLVFEPVNVFGTLRFSATT